MKQPFKSGDRKTYSHLVTPKDIASFATETVHSVYSTFALARDAEWSGRLFVLEMKEEDEEGIGTGLTIRHLSPALVGQTVVFTATLAEVNKNEVVTDYVAKVGDRLIADGRQWQKIVRSSRLAQLFESL